MNPSNPNPTPRESLPVPVQYAIGRFQAACLLNADIEDAGNALRAAILAAIRSARCEAVLVERAECARAICIGCMNGWAPAVVSGDLMHIKPDSPYKTACDAQEIHDRYALPLPPSPPACPTATKGGAS